MREDISLIWQYSKYHPIEQSLYKFISPIVDYRDPRTWQFIEDTPAPAIMIRMQDFLSSNGKHLTEQALYIKKIGGIRNVPRFNHRNIILSSIATKPLTDGLRSDSNHEARYADIINALGVNYCLTGDGPTYGDDPVKSEEELKKILAEVEDVKNRCPGVTLIALLNGHSLARTLKLIEEFKELGIKLFAYYVGQSLYHGNAYNKTRSLFFAREISKRVPWLMIIGGGSNTLFRRYYFADAFAIDAYWVGAHKGVEVHGSKWKKPRHYVKNDKASMMSNFAGLNSILAGLIVHPKLPTYIENKADVEDMLDKG